MFLSCNGSITKQCEGGMTLQKLECVFDQSAISSVHVCVLLMPTVPLPGHYSNCWTCSVLYIFTQGKHLQDSLFTVLFNFCVCVFFVTFPVSSNGTVVSSGLLFVTGLRGERLTLSLSTVLCTCTPSYSGVENSYQHA